MSTHCSAILSGKICHYLCWCWVNLPCLSVRKLVSGDWCGWSKHQTQILFGELSAVLTPQHIPRADWHNSPAGSSHGQQYKDWACRLSACDDVTVKLRRRSLSLLQALPGGKAVWPIGSLISCILRHGQCIEVSSLSGVSSRRSA